MRRRPTVVQNSGNNFAPNVEFRGHHTHLVHSGDTILILQFALCLNKGGHERAPRCSNTGTRGIRIHDQFGSPLPPQAVRIWALAGEDLASLRLNAPHNRLGTQHTRIAMSAEVGTKRGKRRKGLFNSKG
jgi:hypothetical protein